MLPWMLYAALVTVFLSMAALMAAHAARQRQRQTRGFWLAAMVLSVVLPLVMAFASVHVPRLFHAATPQGALALRSTTSIALPAVVFDWSSVMEHAPATRAVDSIAGWAWFVLSMCLFMALAVVAGAMHRQRRQWKQGSLYRTPVLFSSSVGPAVIGIFQPRIVVPAWLAQAPVAQQRHVIAHESEHLRARDPQVLALALGLIVLMPWNLALWWQFHRLRHAVEMDCDARVLRNGGDLHAYCETLIEVGQHRSAYIGMSAGMSESVSFLEQRIKLMLLKPTKWARAWAVGLACLSLGVVAVAAQVTPPGAAPKAEQKVVELSPGVLDGYAGQYKVSDLSVVTVTRSGDHLVLSMNGQVAFKGPAVLTPIGNTRFAVQGMDATVDFMQDVQGSTKALVGRIQGHVAVTANRVDQAAADQINSALAKRIADQTPFPGSEKALQLLLGDPKDNAGMSPGLAEIRKEQESSREKYLAKMGPVNSYKFGGVTDFGWDRYVVQRRNGAEDIYLLVDGKGTIVSAYRHPVNG